MMWPDDSIKGRTGMHVNNPTLAFPTKSDLTTAAAETYSSGGVELSDSDIVAEKRDVVNLSLRTLMEGDRGRGIYVVEKMR